MIPAPNGNRRFLRGDGVAGGPTSIDSPPRSPASASTWRGWTEFAAILAISAREGLANRQNSRFPVRWGTRGCDRTANTETTHQQRWTCSCFKRDIAGTIWCFATGLVGFDFYPPGMERRTTSATTLPCRWRRGWSSISGSIGNSWQMEGLHGSPVVSRPMVYIMWHISRSARTSSGSSGNSGWCGRMP